MKKFRTLNWLLFLGGIVIAIIITTHFQAQAQLPDSYYYTTALAFPAYGYFNTIDSYLLGYNAFNPFLAPAVADAYTVAGIPVFPYLSNPYSTAFPYATLDVLAPYAPPVYPTFTYGTPDIYSLWLGLNL
ncbi:MAG: hypothetical protein ACMUIP_14060 [bacterium]